ncbi:hypothetical protein ACS0TY_007130 [Phlomoides rotata]
MADAAVAFLLEQVSGVIKGYAHLISGAGKEFESLKEDVESLKATLKDLGNKSSKEHGARLIQNQIRDVVYEVEDTIDSWLTQAAALKGNPKSNRCFIWLCPNHVSLANEVKSLREDKVKIMLDKASKMGPVGTTMVEQAKETRTDRPIRQDNVVRLIDAEDIIIGYLKTDQMKLDIIPIIGMPGLGKTTTAWKIFNDESIRSAFPIRIWVHFSQRFNTRNILVQIMKHFASSNEDVISMNNQELSSAVHACLNGSKFLLVMDDVWKKNHWDGIKNALPYGNGNGKVLITSRHMTVGKHVKHITKPHQMRFFTENESWELLQLEVFGNHESCPKELRVIGEHIAKECKGVPLTIVVIGGVLKDSYLSLDSLDMVKKKWEEIARNVNLQLHLGDRVKATSDVVALSYDGLPDHLRECFLYLGVFPAGYEILSRTLTCLWIAEGFIQPEENRSLEKIAEDNLNDLISRNLLMVHKMNPMREVKVCRVHDMIRVFCIDEASKQNLFQETRQSEEDDDGALASKLQRIHRLCLHSDVNKFFSANLKGPRVRSFLSFRKDVVDLESKYNSVIPENYLSLRVLHSKSIKFKEFPQNVTKLNHLRYIVICVADLKILPQSLSQLWNLQTIIVDTNSDSLTMEANIWRMIRLRHVRTKSSIVLDKSWEGDAGKNLQTLNRLSPESVTSAISKKASNLKTLGIRGKLGPLFDNMPLAKLSRLEKLKLHQVGSEKRLQQFPDLNYFTPNLKRLTLSKTFLEWKNMSTLAKIPVLEVLKLKENAFTGISWEAENYAFDKLQFLLILNTDLVLWTASEKTFPCLRHLELKNCENLNAIPNCVLQRLEDLDIGRVRKSIAYSAQNLALQLKLAPDLV